MKKTKAIKNASDICERLLSQVNDQNIRLFGQATNSKVIDSLLNQTDVMVEVYQELNEKLNENEILVFLSLLVLVTEKFNPDETKKERAKKSRLVELNKLITRSSAELASLLWEREQLNITSGFTSNTYYDIHDVIYGATQNNYHFMIDDLNEEYFFLNPVPIFDFEMQPQLSDIIDEISYNSSCAEVLPRDDFVDVATKSVRGSLADYFRVLFLLVKQNRITEGGGGIIPLDFNLSDSSFATCANFALELELDAIVDAQYVKRLRQRIKEQNDLRKKKATKPPTKK